VRLLEAGYERHEIMHMLGRLVSDHVWEALNDNRPYDRERHVAALQALPGSWERERTGRTRQGAMRRPASRLARRRERQGNAIGVELTARRPGPLRPAG